MPVKTCESCILYDDPTKQCKHPTARYINSNDLRMNITRQLAAFMRNTSTLCSYEAYHHTPRQPDLF